MAAGHSQLRGRACWVSRLGAQRQCRSNHSREGALPHLASPPAAHLPAGSPGALFGAGRGGGWNISPWAWVDGWGSSLSLSSLFICVLWRRAESREAHGALIPTLQGPVWPLVLIWTHRSTFRAELIISSWEQLHPTHPSGVRGWALVWREAVPA